MPHTLERTIGGRQFIIKTGVLAGQASGAVTVSYGDTVVLVTVCVTSAPQGEADFFPLTVDYEERLYAAGKIPGGFIRREGRPSQEATLASRLADRSIRPLFPKDFRNGVQIIITVLSTDQENNPDILALIGASAALCISEIPFYGPVGASRVGYIDGKLVLNPTFTELQNSVLDLVVASTRDSVVMVEGDAHEISEELILEAIRFCHEANQEIIDLQGQLTTKCGKPKMKFETHEVSPDVQEAVSSLLGDELFGIVTQQNKTQREQMLAALNDKIINQLGDTYPPSDIMIVLDSKIRAAVRNAILQKGIRPGGRQFTEIRPLSCDVGLLPRTHGSGLFTRGQTQVLTITTLGSLREVQQLDGLTQEDSKRFIHHYNFPPFSVGEVRRIGSTGRREIGHGALAERSLAVVIPGQDEFPYTIRLVSEVLSSNGSSSMASVCASSLSLMDAGVPIKRAVAGVAMGLVTDENGKYVVLTDIEGLEDHYGDMDFKIAGTSNGITGIQLDIKIEGLSFDIIRDTLVQAKNARGIVLTKISETIDHNRSELSRYAPRMIKVTIDPSKIGAVIGTGGKTIRSIIEQTKATIDVQDDGTIYIGSTNEESAQKAIKAIEDLTREVEVGAIYTGKVVRIADFGAFVEIIPGKDGLVHISELSDHRVERVEDEVKIDDEITVVVSEIDHMGRINLSRRAVLDGTFQTIKADRGEKNSSSRRNSSGRSGGSFRRDHNSSRGKFDRPRTSPDQQDRRP